MLTTKIDPYSKQPVKKAKMNPPSLRKHVNCICKEENSWCTGRCPKCNDPNCWSGNECIRPWTHEWKPDTLDKQAAKAWKRRLSGEESTILDGIPIEVINTLTKKT